MEEIFFVSVLGLIPAVIAERKGRNFVLWWVYGVLLFIVALIHSLLLKDRSTSAGNKESGRKLQRQCPHCAEKITEEDVVCSCCGKDLKGSTSYFKEFPS